MDSSLPPSIHGGYSGGIVHKAIATDRCVEEVVMRGSSDRLRVVTHSHHPPTSTEHLLKGLKSEGEDDGIETAEASSP